LDVVLEFWVEEVASWVMMVVLDVMMLAGELDGNGVELLHLIPESGYIGHRQPTTPIGSVSGWWYIRSEVQYCSHY
jgi:hypothetical protein